MRLVPDSLFWSSSMIEIYKQETGSINVDIEIISKMLSDDGWHYNKETLQERIEGWCDRLGSLINYICYDGVCEGRSNSILSGDEESIVYLGLWDKGRIIGIGDTCKRYSREDSSVVVDETLYVLRGHKEGIYYLSYYCSIARVDYSTGEYTVEYTLLDVRELTYSELKKRKDNIMMYLEIRDSLYHEKIYKDYVLHDPYRDR